MRPPFPRELLGLFTLLTFPACVAPAAGAGAEDYLGDGSDRGVTVAALSDYSCDARTDTGYEDGDPFPIDVVTVQDKPVEVATANHYLAMAEAAEADGVLLTIVSGFRTQQEQQHLYDCYVNCNCNNCNLAARPGYGNHQSGEALDLNASGDGVLDWLERRAGEFGFERTVPSEPWHWEYLGGALGDGPCGHLEPPTPDDCPIIDGGGAVLEESSGCFFSHGPREFWRDETGTGHGGSLRWTNAFQGESPSNWARWYTTFAEAGSYRIEIWAQPEFSVHREARYAVRHAGREDEVVMNLSVADGWVTLATFEFAEGADQHLSLYDNAAEQVAPDQHIPADAIRVTLVSDDPADPPDDTPFFPGAGGGDAEEGDPGPAPGSTPGPRRRPPAMGTCGASSAAAAETSPVAFGVMLVLLGVARRRPIH